jgi:hypothetical protein
LTLEALVDLYELQKNSTESLSNFLIWRCAINLSLIREVLLHNFASAVIHHFTSSLHSLEGT